jgi:hypothetical protein
MRYDNQGRPVVSADWNALSSIPAIVKNLGNLTTTAGGIIVATDTAGSLENLPAGSAKQVMRIDATSNLPAYGTVDPSMIDTTGASDGQVITNVSGVSAWADSGSGGVTAGTFTATLLGVADFVTGTINYATDGTRVTLWALTEFGGTSDSDYFGFTGLPDELQPAVNGDNPAYGIVSNSCIYINNDNIIIGIAYVWSANFETPGEVDFYVLETGLIANQIEPASNGWTPTGGKYISQGWTISYPIGV